MNYLLPSGRAFFGLGLIGFGLLHFFAGRAWPAGLPGQLAWAVLLHAPRALARFSEKPLHQIPLLLRNRRRRRPGPRPRPPGHRCRCIDCHTCIV